MKISIMSYSFHGLHNVGAIDLYGYLYTLKYRYGINIADIWNGFIKSYEDSEIEKLKNMLNELDMTVAALCCDQAHVWDDDPEVRAGNEKMALNCIKLAKAIGAKTIRIDVGVRDEKFPKEKLDYVVSKYTEYCALAAEFGAKLGPENHWGCSRDPESLQLLFDRMADVPNFGLQLHLGGWHSGDPDENDLHFVKYAMHMHIDFQHCYNLNDQHLLKLRDAGYDGVWSVESHFGKNEYANVAFQLANVKRILKPNHYEVAPEAVHMLLDRTVPGFADGIKQFIAYMMKKMAEGKSIPRTPTPKRELPKY
jgi:sugar phosphate isomerase/epimerase